MGVNTLFKPRKHFYRGGGFDAGNDGDTVGGDGYSGSGETTGDTSNDNTGPGGSSDPTGGNWNNPVTQFGPPSPDPTEKEDKPIGFVQGIYDFFTGLAPTAEEQFGNQWNSLPSWEKQKMLDKLDFDPTNMTDEALDAFSAASNMSWADIQELTSNISMEDFTGLPGSIGAAFNMFDAINPFTNTQYNLQDIGNWSQDDITSNNLGTYTGSIASLNSQQLADLASMQQGGLNQTQIGQAIAGMVADSETAAAGRGPDPEDPIVSDEDQAIADAQALYDDLISRGFSESMAKRMLENGNYFASYDSV